METFHITPDLVSISKSKRKFIYLGISFLLFNFYCISRYVQLALSGELAGYYLLIFTLVNLPLFVVAIILLFVPRMHRAHYAKLEYKFGSQGLDMGSSFIGIPDIEMLEVVEFYSDFYRVYVFCKDGKHVELWGISSKDLNQIKSWANFYSLKIM